MDPLSAIAVGMGGFNIISSIISGNARARAARDMGAYRASMMEFNSRLSMLQAKDALERGEKTAEQYGGEIRRAAGAQQASAASRGVVATEGSAAEVVAETERMGAEDLITIRNNAWRESWGYEIQAQDLLSQAEMTRRGAQFEAGQASLTGWMNAANSAIQTGMAVGRGGSGSRGGGRSGGGSPFSLTNTDLGYRGGLF